MRTFWRHIPLLTKVRLIAGQRHGTTGPPSTPPGRSPFGLGIIPRGSTGPLYRVREFLPHVFLYVPRPLKSGETKVLVNGIHTHSIQGPGAQVTTPAAGGAFATFALRPSDTVQLVHTADYRRFTLVQLIRWANFPSGAAGSWTNVTLGILG